MKNSVFVINGPNLNLLGTREPTIYGTQTLADIEQDCVARAERLGLAVEFVQSNSESQLIDWVHQARGSRVGLIINAGAYTHTSIALMDALRSCDIPVVEVHLSNIHQREAFRHHSYISKVAWGVICGFGAFGYQMAIEAISYRLRTQSTGAKS